MTSLIWFRFEVAFAFDPLIQALSHADQRHFVILLCLKGAGHLDKRVPAKLRNDMVARALGIPVNEVEALHQRLKKLKLVTPGWQIVDWKKRQFRSDTSVERTRKWRNKKKTCDAAVMSPRCHGDGLHTETHTDIHRERPRTCGDSLSHDDRQQGGTRLTESFIVPPAWIDEAVKAGLSQHTAESEAAKFPMHYVSLPGDKGVRSDWHAVWRLWFLRAIEQQDPHYVTPRTDDEWKAAGASIGIHPRPGEDWHSYKARVTAEKRKTQFSQARAIGS